MSPKRNHLPGGIRLQNPLHLLAVGFGSGASPYAPGMAGTLVAIPIYWLMQLTPMPVYTLLLAIMIFVGFWLCDVADKAIGVHDHPSIVWDEIVGYLLTMWAVPATWMWMLLGFLLFRLFDIWKPAPIGWINTHVGGGVGMVVDDLMAAVYAGIVLHVIILAM
jgi:phosphatidylglycerophosphatase A